MSYGRAQRLLRRAIREQHRKASRAMRGISTDRHGMRVYRSWDGVFWLVKRWAPKHHFCRECRNKRFIRDGRSLVTCQACAWSTTSGSGDPPWVFRIRTGLHDVSGGDSRYRDAVRDFVVEAQKAGYSFHEEPGEPGFGSKFVMVKPDGS